MSWARGGNRRSWLRNGRKLALSVGDGWFIEGNNLIRLKRREIKKTKIHTSFLCLLENNRRKLEKKGGKQPTDSTGATLAFSLSRSPPWISWERGREGVSEQFSLLFWGRYEGGSEERTGGAEWDTMGIWFSPLRRWICGDVRRVSWL